MILDDYMVTEEMPIIDVMNKIDKNASGNIFVCRERFLLAVVTDGDIRRSIMKNVDMKIPISVIANYAPCVLTAKESYKAIEIMKRKMITALPIVDEKGYVIDIKFLLTPTVFLENKINIPVVIMAGGKGTRLKPYTDILPKPLIPIGEKTVTEHILEHFERCGCQDFYMIVNYKKNFIKSYFADSEQKRNINFLEEDTYLGTGGGLILLRNVIEETFFLTNCDILIEEDYEKILREHKVKKNIITIVCARKKMEIPYGTVDITGEGTVTRFVEKPSYNFITSTGFYVIEPEFIDEIEEKQELPITNIIQRCINEGKKVGTYLIDEEYWMDMGQLEELEKMKEKMGI